MDLTLLDSILECSVCLDRLKQDARVLPCQHTFCLECLRRVANKNPTSPLACPECRQQTNTFDIDSLPKNVFLIRLLDQIKPTNGAADANEQNTPNTTTTTITTATKDPEQKQSKESPQVPYAKALFDFCMNPLDDEGCLKFQKGMIIQVTRRVDQNWAEGKLGETVGIFPLSFVSMNPAATALMQSYATKWRLPASMPPSTDQTPSTSTSPQRQILQPTPAHPTPKSSQNNPTSSLNNPTPVNNPTSSLNNQTPVKNPTPSTNITPTPSVASPQVPHDKNIIYIALHNYTPQKPDELELKKGAQYIVKETCQDGWLKGCSSDNLFKKGVFPGNYVMPLYYHQKMMAMQRNVQRNLPATNTQQMRTTGAYTNLGLSSVPPELPQRNVVQPRNSQSPQQQKSNENSPSAQSTQKTDENVNKQRKESMTELLMKKLGYNRKSNESSAYSMDNPVFEDTSAAAGAKGKSNQLQFNHMRSGSCPSNFVCPPELGVMNVNIENLQYGSQRVKIRERSALPMMGSDDKSTPNSQKRHSINLSGPPSTSKNLQNSQLKAQHRKSSSLDTSLDPANSIPPERYRCVTKYPANSRFELSLNVGDVVILQKKRDNGWYKGELSRTGQVGLFPANFVELMDN